MTSSRLPKRKIAVVNIADPTELAESIATATRGRAAALTLLRQAVAYLEGNPT
jgi:hypothetical protein